METMDETETRNCMREGKKGHPETPSFSAYRRVEVWRKGRLEFKIR